MQPLASTRELLKPNIAKTEYTLDYFSQMTTSAEVRGDMSLIFQERQSSFFHHTSSQVENAESLFGDVCHSMPGFLSCLHFCLLIPFLTVAFDFNKFSVTICR